MEEKRILITGSTDGIGRQSALELAQTKSVILLHGRNREKGDKVLKEIKEKTSNKEVELYIADFASFKQVRKLAEEIRSSNNRLDVLINNAGIYRKKRETTEDGNEMTFQVNFLSPFLLTNLLLETLKKSEPSRIINVSSVTHQSADFNLNNLQGEVKYDGYNAYSISKLCNLMFTIELAQKLKDTGVTVNALHPGVIGTKLLAASFDMAGGSIEEGAETIVFLAISPEVEKKSGKYFVRKIEAGASSTVYNDKKRKELWDLSEELTGLK